MHDIIRLGGRLHIGDKVGAANAYKHMLMPSAAKTKRRTPLKTAASTASHVFERV